MKSFKLLSQRRFLPFFLVQFSFAFNDNTFKNVLVLLMAFNAASEAESGLIASAAAALLIVPFFIFSPLAGQIADKYPKDLLIKWIKFSEILIIGIGCLGFIFSIRSLLFFSLFLLGTHSAFFGPIKFSLLPQVFEEDELLGANALVELGTFLAILLGTIAGGMLSTTTTQYICSVLFLTAVFGWLCSLFVPGISSTDPGLKINLNPLSEFRELYRLATKPSAIFRSILGVSWFWFLGSAIMIQLPAYTQYGLYADKHIVTLLLATFCVSIGVGAIICEMISGDNIEIGLVPLGALGISLFFFDLYLNVLPPTNTQLTLSQFWSEGSIAHWRAVFDIFGMGFSGAFFIIPLNSFMQHRSESHVCSRIIAANNVANAMFMILASVFVSSMYALGLSTHTIFLALALLNIAVSIYAFFLVPDFTLRFICWLLASTIYRIRYESRGAIPMHGPAIIIANHVSYIDWFILAAAARRPVRFVMWYKFFEAPFITWIFKLGKAIPIASAKENAQLKEQAFVKIRQELADDNLIVIFPEGTLTKDGNLGVFRPGIEEIQRQFRAPIIPIALTGLWGSYFSRSGGKAIQKVPKPRWRRINVTVGSPLHEYHSADQLHEIIERMIRQAESTENSHEVIDERPFNS